MKSSKNKIVNDPVWGFIELNSDLHLELIEHPYFQRLRRIKQLGLSSLVYPGANHTRFEHAIGTMHLVRSALDVLKRKGNKITEEEEEGVMVALLLHDIGHGPFSHALEQSIVQGVSHEELSRFYMDELNREMDGRLSLAIDIFLNCYSKRFLHQLVSGQLDMDRLDFLKRDSFYSGVSEGVVSSERIIQMLNVQHDQLVVEVKGIYSVEKFLIARRLMYWQVYLHKTVLSAEHMMIKLLQRASDLASSGEKVSATPYLALFLNKEIKAEDFRSGDLIIRKRALHHFAYLDDADILCTIKGWMEHPDPILSNLSRALIDRKLFKIKLSQTPFSESKLDNLRELSINKFGISLEETAFFVIDGEITNSAYDAEAESIYILYKNGKLKDIKEASDINLGGLTKTVRKHFVCYPREIITR
ncbi:MAG: HD domain-containing protein [Bacteroidia bacterium]|nr:HD domain-containing protein [Bacteroidia bacterium]